MSGGAGDVQAKFLFEGGKELSTGNFKTTEQVQFKVDVLNRDHLVGLLKGWLGQRSHAMGNSVNREYPMHLLQIVQYYQLAPFKDFMKVIRQHKAEFLKCVPGVERPTYKHYEKEIKPWLDYCLGLNNGV